MKVKEAAPTLGCKVGKTYPKNCHLKTMVCDPVATSFGDVCGIQDCKKIT